jgi:hypothetical protein
MSKMGSHDPFGYLKHKLWPKERSKLKLPIWLPTTRSQESPQFTHVQVACHIPLKSYWWKLQLCFKHLLNQRFPQKVMGIQSCSNPHFGNFKTPNLGVKIQNDIWVQVLWPSAKNIIRGKVITSLQSGLWWILWVYVCPLGLSVHQKCFNYALTNLLFGLRKFVWIIDLLVTRPSPHFKAPSRLSTFEMLWATERTPTFYPSVVFTLNS